ncbi:MAG: ROK family transcriptional regulator [Longimicrobiales bacterium]|nr:ROK family transcriptional regulator [Longimicrobiales bacterium]
MAKKRGILNQVFRSERCSRFELAQRLNINATMVGRYVNEFLDVGILLEGEPVQSRPGRAPVPLQLNPDYGTFVGLDFEALRARAVLCDFGGGVLKEEEVSLPASPSREEALETITELARRMVEQADGPVFAVGVAAPGQVDVRSGRILHYRLLPDFDQVPVRERMEAALGPDVPVFVEDNIRAVAYAELLRGAGRGNSDFLCLAVRSGVGLGIVIDGRVYRGANALAGEVGYTVLPTDGGPKLVTDLVSATGFVESTRAMLRSWQKTDSRQRLLDKGEDLRLSDLVEEAQAGDDLLDACLEELGERLGTILANLANLFAPEKIVLSGEVPNCCSTVRQALEETFREHVLPQILKTTYLEDGRLGGIAGALGAAWMGFSWSFPEDEETILAQVRSGSAGTHAEDLDVPARAP